MSNERYEVHIWYNDEEKTEEHYTDVVQCAVTPTAVHVIMVDRTLVINFAKIDAIETKDVTQVTQDADNLIDLKGTGRLQ